MGLKIGSFLIDNGKRRFNSQRATKRAGSRQLQNQSSGETNLLKISRLILDSGRDSISFILRFICVILTSTRQFYFMHSSSTLVSVMQHLGQTKYCYCLGTVGFHSETEFFRIAGANCYLGFDIIYFAVFTKGQVNLTNHYFLLIIIDILSNLEIAGHVPDQAPAAGQTIS